MPHVRTQRWRLRDRKDGSIDYVSVIVCVYIYIYMCVCIYVYIYIYMCVYMYIYIMLVRTIVGDLTVVGMIYIYIYCLVI